MRKKKKIISSPTTAGGTNACLFQMRTQPQREELHAALGKDIATRWADPILKYRAREHYRFKASHVFLSMNPITTHGKHHIASVTVGKHCRSPPILENEDGSSNVAGIIHGAVKLGCWCVRNSVAWVMVSTVQGLSLHPSQGHHREKKNVWQDISMGREGEAEGAEKGGEEKLKIVRLKLNHEQLSDCISVIQLKN